MLSKFHTWSEQDKKIFVAKILHEVNYSQTSLELMESILKVWEAYPSRQANYFFNQNTLNYGTASN